MNWFRYTLLPCYAGIAIVLCLLAHVPVYAQFSNARVLDVKSGLSDVNVRVIDKDHYGFIWIGTQYGLNRYDGSQVRQFLYSPDDPNSILNNDIQDLVIDSQRLWIGGTYGISKMDLRDFSISNIQFDCDGVLDSTNLQHPERPEVVILHLDEGILWICTRQCGLMRYDPATNEMRRISFAGHKKSTPGVVAATALDMILGFAPDPAIDSIYWIGTAAGLIRFNNQALTHTHFYKDTTDLLFQDDINTFRRIVYHSDGLIYYLTWGHGVQVFDPVTHGFSPLILDGEVDADLRTRVSMFSQHDEYNLWLRTYKGLYMYNTGLNKTINFYPNPDGDVRYLGAEYIDASNRRFIATSKGIYIHDPLHEQFLMFSYEDLNVPDWHGFARKVIAHPDGNYITVLGQSVDGLYHYSHRQNAWFETPIPGYSSDPGSGFNGLDFTNNDQYGWVFSGTEDLFWFDPEKFTATQIDLGIDLSRRRFADIEWDRQGRLWIGTAYEGVLRWTPGSAHAEQFKDEIYGDAMVTASPSATSLYCDSQGNMWMATSVGHSVYDAATQQFRNFNYQKDGLRTLEGIANFAEAWSGSVWLVTHRGILARADAKHPESGFEIVKSVFARDESPGYVEGIVYGPDNCMFVLSANTLFKIDSTLGISGFSMDYTPFAGDYFAFDHLSEASLVVGLRNQFAVLYSTGLRRNRELPRPYLTEVTINERPYRGNFVGLAPILSLRHNENFVSFSFSAISFTLPEKNRFRYRLNAFDPDWIDAGSRRFANYTNIPSGDYMFELLVANNEGVVNPEIYPVPIHIARAWWATWWFRIVAAVFIISIAALAYRLRIGQIRKEARLKAEFDKKLGDVELSALRAQMNPHFIFNCLNSIENYIIKNESMKAAEYINDFARLIRLILQNSRSQYIPLTDEIEALDLYLQMESMRFDNKFEYHIDIHEGLEPTEIDIPPMLIQPFVENAIWHGLIPKNASGNLRIDLSRENGALRCVIQDDGIGREKAREINASMQKRGKKSMGMLITKNRIDVINELYDTHATVQITDLKDETGSALGTRVELDIPIE